MTSAIEIKFTKLALPRRGSVIVLTDTNLKLGDLGENLDHESDGCIRRAIRAEKFKGEFKKSLTILAPFGSKLDRIVVVGLGNQDELTNWDWMRLGGTVGAMIPKSGDVTFILQRPDMKDISPSEASGVGLGLKLRRYAFSKYKTGDEADKTAARRIKLAVPNPAGVTKQWAVDDAVAEGVYFARDLVNEPANILGPVEFADRLKTLKEVGVQVRILDEKALEKSKMGALLGVAQGSARPPRVAVMRWRGTGSKNPDLALIGKGVVFDTGGISIKPSAGMEDMKGDMGGAAAVAGAMRAVAGRKAKAHVIGIVGLVENMPDGKAQRPGDVVTSMSGKTIEVLNTDAEGRLVLADIMSYAQKSHKPKAMIDLATLTGAIIVSLGNYHAGLFANDDELSSGLVDAGMATGEKVWRMPLGQEYDKMIDSKIADMKNIGGRWGGSITAAQFLQRFVENDTPWAHLDVAGVAMGSKSSEINTSWGSGFGVRLLDRLIADRCETKS